jgi:hypothetical protein
MYQEYYKLLNHLFTGVSIKPVLSDYVTGKRKGACEFDDKGLITVINISQTLIKRLLFKGEERPDICAKQIYETLLTGNTQYPKSDAMALGIYFETKLLGNGAYENVDDLPRNKRTGNKTAAHERIEETILLAKRVFGETGIIINHKNTQVQCPKPYTEHNFKGVQVFLKGIADIISPFKYKNLDYPVCCLDVKLSKDVNNTFIDKKRPWKYYPWGTPEEMDHTQGYLYSPLFEMPFVYLIFDYGKVPKWKPIPVETTFSNPDSTEARNRHRELLQSINWVIEKIQMWQDDGFPAQPQDYLCKDCPVYTCEQKKLVRFT